MFGTINPCYFNFKQKEIYQSHLCGICISLKKQFGNFSRINTNTEGVILSVLCEAQKNQPAQTLFYRCALNKFKSIPIVAPSDISVSYAAHLSLLMGATKLLDHTYDKDNWMKFFSFLIKKISCKWYQKVKNNSNKFNFNVDLISNEVNLQNSVEKQSGNFNFFSTPTQNATGYAFAHTALLAQKPENRKNLLALGKNFGKIIFLLDHYQDYKKDLKKKKFNALSKIPS